MIGYITSSNKTKRVELEMSVPFDYNLSLTGHYFIMGNDFLIKILDGNFNNSTYPLLCSYSSNKNDEIPFLCDFTGRNTLGFNIMLQRKLKTLFRCLYLNYENELVLSDLFIDEIECLNSIPWNKILHKFDVLIDYDGNVWDTIQIE